MEKLTIYYLNGNDLLMESHYLDKGYRDDVLIKIQESFYEVYFFTADALEYEMTRDGYFSLPGMIILEEITTDKITIALKQLVERGYFNHLNKLTDFDESLRFSASWYNPVVKFDHSKIMKVVLID